MPDTLLTITDLLDAVYERAANRVKLGANSRLDVRIESQAKGHYGVAIVLVQIDNDREQEWILSAIVRPTLVAGIVEAATAARDGLTVST